MKRNLAGILMGISTWSVGYCLPGLWPIQLPLCVIGGAIVGLCAGNILSKL